MTEVNYEELSDEDLKYFQWEFTKLFVDVKSKITEIEADRAKYMRKGSRIDDVKLSPFGKVALIAKKVFVNSAVSLATGIEPEFLDNDTRFMRNNDKAKMDYYMRCDPAILAYNIAVDLRKGLEKFLNRLSSNNKNEVISCLKNVDVVHKSLMKYPVSKDAISFESLIYPILYDAKILDVDKYNRMEALSNRGYRIGLTKNFMNDVNEVYDRYERNNVKRK